MKKKVILITGISSGLGKTTATFLAKKGHIVLGTSRKGPHIDKISVSKNISSPILIQMDVTNIESIKNVFSSIQKKIGKIDVLINNAGWGISGPIEETPVDQARALFETNFFGMFSVTKQVLPIMRKQQKGLIINISSIGGIIGLPYQGFYSASKFAIEGFSEALRMEVNTFGIDVVLVEPGDFKTGFTKNRKKILSPSSPYIDSVNKTTSIFEHDEQTGSDPLLCAYKINKIIDKEHPKIRYRVGSLSQRFIACLKGVISDRIIQWILIRYYKLK